jgi:hypothetical protein
MDNKITHQSIKDLLAKGLKEDDLVGRVAVLRGLMRIYSLQTDSEKDAEDTHYYNSVGFTGFDGNILTSIAKSFLQYNRLTEKQYNLVAKKMQKYWKQLYMIATGKMESIPDVERLVPNTHPSNWILLK